MNFYFYSNVDCVLKVNGNFIGKISKNYTEFDLIGNEFLEFTPLNVTLNSCNFYLTDNLKGILFNFGNYRLIIPKFLTLRILPYKIIFQKTFNNDFCLTVTTDGAIKYYLSGAITVTDELPFLPTIVDLITKNDCVFLVFKADKTLITAYDFSGNLLFRNYVDDYEIDNNFSFIKTNCLYNTLKFNFTYDISTSFKILTANLVTDISNISQILLPYCFLTCVLLGVDASNFLHPQIIERKNDLIEFIGNFEKILPPINYCNGEVLIVFENEIKVLKFIINENKISNVFIND